MILTSDYKNILATFRSDIRYSREPKRGKFSSDYYFTVGPLEYRVQFSVYREGSDIYVMMFRPESFQGTPEEQAAFLEKVTGNSVEDAEDIEWLMDDWLDSGGSLKLTGTGSSFQVISNVISTINKFLKEKESIKRPVHCLIFAADKEEESRVRVYSKIANMYKSQGFTVEIKPEGKYLNFYICRAN